MTARAALTIALALAAIIATAGDTWNGAADDDEWYAFNFVDDTWDPQVWVNNWDVVYYRYPGDPEPQGMSTPTETANIPLGYSAYNDSPVSIVTLNLDGILEVKGIFYCGQANIAGNLRLGYHGHVESCAIQGDGPSGYLSSTAVTSSSLSGPTLQDVTLSLPTEIANERRIGIAGQVHNLNVIQLLGTAVAGQARLVVDADATLSGPGWLETSDAADNEIASRFNPHQRLTNQTTIHAAGRIGTDSIALTNEGLIIADRTTMLTVDPTDTPADGQPGVVNTATLRAADGGTLRLERGTFANAGGVIEALDGSFVELGRACGLSGGTLATTGSGVIRSSHEHGNTTTDPQVRDLTVTGTLEVPDARRLEVAGTVTVNGAIELTSAGTTAHLVVDSATSLAGAGEVVLSDAATNQIAAYNAPGNRLTTSVVIRGAGSFENIAVTNTGTIKAEGTTPLVIDPTDAPVDSDPPFANQGSLIATPGAVLRLENGWFDNAGGVVRARTGGVVELGVDGDISGGTLQTLGSGVFRSTTSWHPPSLIDLTNEGYVEVPDTGGLQLGGTITNDGTILATNTFLYPLDALVLAGSGQLVLRDGAQIRPSGIDVTNWSGHTILVDGTGSAAIHRDLMNHGLLSVAAGTALDAAYPYSAGAGSTTLVDGTLLLSSVLPMAGALTGSGTVSGAVELGASGVLDPGGVGTLTCSHLTVLDGAAYLWESSSARGVDLVQVTGTLDLGAAVLHVEPMVLSGAVPDRIELFAYGTLASTPDSWQFELPAGWSFSGVDTSGNVLALTGVTYSDHVFADDFESGDTSEWSGTVGASKRTLPAGTVVTEEGLEIPAHGR
jgi:hypothetical protein